MESEITINLKDMHFFAHHGLHDHEKKNGNEFEVDVSISFKHPDKVIVRIGETIDYAAVYKIIEKEIQKPNELLETLLHALAQTLKRSFPQITKIDLAIYKLSAPIEGLNGKVGVQLNRSYI